MAREELEEQIKALPDTAGCYIYRNGQGEEIYIGKAKRIRRRVRSYFRGHEQMIPRLRKLVSEIVSIDHICTASEVEALILENRLIKEFKPRYNVNLKDDKSYPYLAISQEEFPRVYTTRDREEEKHADLIGPFASMIQLRQAYHYLMRVFQFRSCDLIIDEHDKKRRYFRPCLNYHIKRCSAPCTLKISREDYAADIEAFRSYLQGKSSEEVAERLRKYMQQASQDMRYEDAARYRDQLQALGRIGERGERVQGAADSFGSIRQEALQQLRRLVNLPVPPRIIEGFDLAHLQGEHVVASMVQFVDGQPNNEAYRRYRIRSNVGEGKSGNNDFAGMHEVILRRYRRVRDEELPIPDVILIDGGIGQVHKAQEALQELGLDVPCLVGLAKAEETLVFPDGREHRAGKRNGGLKILMQVRDEAHRFCRRYFHLLQRKELLD